MAEQLLAFNSGALNSRLRRRYALPDFDDAELTQLIHSQLKSTRPKYGVSDDKYVRIAARRLGKGRGAVGFANARATKALLEAALERQTARVLAERRAAAGSGGGGAVDIFELNRLDLIGAPPALLTPENCAPLRALREMEGLGHVKGSIDALLKIAESNAQREELELPPSEVSLNRIFLGNPGTGKSACSRLDPRMSGYARLCFAALRALLLTQASVD